MIKHLASMMLVDITDKTVKGYQTERLREAAAPKTINEEVGFLLRLLGERGELIRAQLRKQKSLKLKGSKPVAKAYSAEEKQKLGGGIARGAFTCHLSGPDAGPQCGDADSEIRHLRWNQVWT